MDEHEEEGSAPAPFELRFFADGAGTELRFAGAEGQAKRKVDGLAAPFGAATKIRTYIGDFTEELAPGCFAEDLRSGADIRFLFEHDRTQLLARTKAGNLLLRETARGLEFDADLPDTTLARDVAEQIRVKNIAGMSFGFFPLKSDRSYDGQGRLVSVVHRAVRLTEISATTQPAYARTSVALRSVATRHPTTTAPGQARPLAGDLALRARLLKLRG